MKKLPFFFALAGLNCYSQTIPVKNIETHIKFLASDKLKGRGTASKEEKLAADYIAKEFKKAGLQPKGDADSFMHSFTFKRSNNPHDTSTSGAVSETSNNVAGYLENGSQETIVIGAHYDHLGLGHDHNSTDANPEGKIHNGADDNASGTAGVIELARYFAGNNRKEKYNFLFICFSGEELGLIGSKRWCENPTLPLSTINYMINMDMIGRLNDSSKKLIIYGVGTSPVWVPIIDSLPSTFSIKKDSSGIGPSDQTSFYMKDIPVLHFFTGQHSDYHKPSDDFEKINYKGEVKVLEYIIKIIETTDSRPKLKFLKTRNPDMGKVSMKVTLGVMPDYAFEGKGLRIDGVTDNRPASKAGIMPGDVIFKVGDITVDNIQDYMKALSLYKKGDTVTVKLLRAGKQMELPVTF